ncbi:MAG: Dps family protein [Fimbriimonadaceae bacterium]
MIDLDQTIMDTKAAAASLGRVLADSYVLLLKTQNVHWHVVGGAFVGVHTLTEQQYNELFLAVDEVAERIRALGAAAPGTMADYLKLARLKEGLGGADDASMVRGLVDAHAEMSDLLRKEIDIMDDLDDYGSEDLLVQRLRVHEKAAWMLRSILEQIGAVKAVAPAKVAAPAAAKVEVAPKVEVKKEAKPAKKEKKAKKAKAEPEVAAKKEVPVPVAKKAEPVVASNNGSGRRKLFGVKADG